MILRVLIATRPWKQPADTIVIDVVGQGICRGKCAIRFGSVTRFKAFSAILTRQLSKFPLSRKELVEILYEDDPDGGPMLAENILSRTMTMCNRRFLPLGLRFVTSKKISCGGHRCLEAVDLWPAERMAA